MKLSEYKGDAALDLLADLIDPFCDILSDKEIAENLRTGGKKLTAVKLMIKKHKRAVVEIMAALDGKDPDTYEVGVLTLPMKLLELLNDPELMSLFTSAEQTGGAKPSGSASENTDDAEA